MTGTRRCLNSCSCAVFPTPDPSCGFTLYNKTLETDEEPSAPAGTKNILCRILTEAETAVRDGCERRVTVDDCVSPPPASHPHHTFANTSPATAIKYDGVSLR